MNSREKLGLALALYGIYGRVIAETTLFGAISFAVFGLGCAIFLWSESKER